MTEQQNQKYTDVRLAREFQDGMLLQREKPVRIRGTAQPDTEIRAELQGRTGHCRADAQGNWEMVLDPLEASEEETLTVQWNGGSICRRQIAVGELWLAGGQSNMEFQLCFEKHYAEEKDLPENRNIRFYDMPKISYDGQDQDFDYSTMGVWRTANPEERKYFSAIGYYFAKELEADLKIPVGILGCNWGGTTSSEWMRRESVRELDNYWWHKFQERSAGMDWDSFFKSQKNEPLNDCGNLTELPFNKVMMPRTVLEEEAPKLLQGMAIPDFSRLRVTEIPGALYEHMLVPASRMAVRGVLWYQGESDDETEGALYESMLRTLLRDWRGLWQERLPFLVVQLPGWERWLFQENRNFAAIRMAQKKVADADPDTFLCSIADLGEQYDIHPKDKRGVGYRLSLLARTHIYGESVAGDPPQVTEVRKVGDSYEIRFSHAPGGLEIKGKEIPDLQCVRNGENIPYQFTLQNDCLRIHPAGACDRIRMGMGKWIRINLYNKAGLPAVPFDLSVPEEHF